MRDIGESRRYALREYSELLAGRALALASGNIFDVMDINKPHPLLPPPLVDRELLL